MQGIDIQRIPICTPLSQHGWFKAAFIPWASEEDREPVGGAAVCEVHVDAHTLQEGHTLTFSSHWSGSRWSKSSHLTIQIDFFHIKYFYWETSHASFTRAAAGITTYVASAQMSRWSGDCVSTSEIEWQSTIDLFAGVIWPVQKKMALCAVHYQRNWSNKRATAVRVL